MQRTYHRFYQLCSELCSEQITLSSVILYIVRDFNLGTLDFAVFLASEIGYSVNSASSTVGSSITPVPCVHLESNNAQSKSFH